MIYLLFHYMAEFIIQSSKQGIKYKGEKSHEAIMRFVLDRLDIHIHEISKSLLKGLLKGKESTERPALIFVCGEDRYCFTADERLRIAATFVSKIHRLFHLLSFNYTAVLFLCFAMLYILYYSLLLHIIIFLLDLFIY